MKGLRGFDFGDTLLVLWLGLWLAGLATQVWPSTDALRAVWQEDRHFKPKMKARDRSARVKAWKRAVRKA